MFLKSALSFSRLEYLAMRFYPSSFILTIVQSFVTTGMWFFVSIFLKDYADKSLESYGGDFVSYMVIGVFSKCRYDYDLALSEHKHCFLGQTA